MRIPRERDERGASSVEYALIVVAIAALIVSVVYALGVVTEEGYGDTCGSIRAETVGSSDCA